MEPLTPLVLQGTVLPGRSAALRLLTGTQLSCGAAWGCTSHHFRAEFPRWNFSLQGFSSVLVPMQISDNRVLLSLQVCLVGFAVSKQIISGGGQEEGEMRGKCLAGQRATVEQ